jgi:hypothetical protein
VIAAAAGGLTSSGGFSFGCAAFQSFRNSSYGKKTPRPSFSKVSLSFSYGT